jgi:opacity protein-like surface antigen
MIRRIVLGAGMATAVFGGVLAGWTSSASAADLGYDELRGAILDDEPVGQPDWSGVYAGAQAGYANANVDFGNATSDLVAHILRDTIIENEAQVSNWTALSDRDARRGAYGAFIGYNSQWDDVVLGFELNYNHSDLEAKSSDQLGRGFVTSDNYTYNVGIDAQSSVKITDYMTFRGRAGYVIGSFLPYATLGLAVGRANVQRSVAVSADAYDYSGAGRPPLSLDPNPTVLTDNKNNDFTYGLAAGVGLDVLVAQNVFLRGEYEYIRFTSFSKAKADISTVRGAVGVKF